MTSVEKEYLKLFFQQACLQWEIYACEAAHDLAPLDRQLYHLIKDNQQPPEFSGRKREIWHKIVTRSLVDRHPDVAHLRNRLDNWDNYLDEAHADLTTDTARSLLAQRMRPDVLQLIELRNQLAQRYGFLSYAELALNCEDLESRTVLEAVKDYLYSHLERARTLVQEHRMTWETWFQIIDTIGDIQFEYQPQTLMKELLNQLGLEDLHQHIKLVVRERGLAGYTGCLAVPDDIRILLRENHSLHGVKTLFHELGHAVYHAANREQGLYVTWSYTEDEVMAVVFECIGIEIMLGTEQAKAVESISLLENVRCAISTLFEHDLWHQPSAAETLYLKHYSKLGMPIVDPGIWALDSFRSIDPVYIHSYVLGAQIAERTLSYLREEYGDCYHKWGQWLRQNYYEPGRRVPLFHKLRPVFNPH